MFLFPSVSVCLYKVLPAGPVQGFSLKNWQKVYLYLKEKKKKRTLAVLFSILVYTYV